MTFDSSFWLSISFILFFALLGRRLWEIVRSQVDQYRDAIANEFKEAQRLHTEAYAMLKDIQKKNDEAEQHAAALVAHAQQEVERLKENSARELEEFVRRKEQAALERIKIAEVEIMRDLREQALNRALQITEEKLKEALTPERDYKMVERALDILKESA